MADNGRIPESQLTPIPGGRLTPEAAANWLAMRNEGGRRLGIWISPLGPVSSYRTLAQQQKFWNDYLAGRGNLAAHPGTSNHGLGHAVDLAAPPVMRRVVDQFGGPYGWRWGEVQREQWHVTYYGGGKAKPGEVEADQRSLGRGDSGDDVKRVQTWLSKHKGELGIEGKLGADGKFGPNTESAVNRLYRAYGHEPHDHFGDVGWAIIEDKHPWCVLKRDEREHLADLFATRRVARRHGGWDKVDASHRQKFEELRDWLLNRRKEIWRAGKKSGWRQYNRKRRYMLLKKVTDGAGKRKAHPKRPHPAPARPPRHPAHPRRDRDEQLVARLRTLGLKRPGMAVAEARRAGLPLAAALAFLEKESSGIDRDGVHRFGLNLFGSDVVRNPVKGGRVSQARYQRYLQHRRAGLGMQGVGPCQLTWWEFQDMADQLGGCWQPRYNLRVGFTIAQKLLRQHGDHGGAMRWNGTGPAAVRYADDWQQRRRKWEGVLR